ncbi:hypothetical protein [Salsuginibacillus halophilus]|nr:hypothetical protein [Salsuginibacillus halophilus]
MGTLFAITTVVLAHCFYYAYRGLFKHQHNKTQPEMDRQIVNVRPIKNELFTAYVVSFFLPILNTSFTSVADTLTFLIIMVLLFVLSLQVNMYYFNPLMLVLFKYQAFEVKVHDHHKLHPGDPQEAIILSKRDLDFFSDRPYLKLVKIKDGVYYHKHTYEKEEATADS